jgi:hypothetical protein
MFRLVPIAYAGALALATTLAIASPAFADPRGDAAGAAIAGGVLGFMAGAAAADDGYDWPPPRFHHGWRIHVRMCLDRYGWRYDPRTDLVRWHGQLFRCDEWPDRPAPRPRFAPPPDYGPAPNYGPAPDYGY